MRAQLLVSCLLFAAVFCHAQQRGELRLTITDPSGAVVAAKIRLVSQAKQFDRSFAASGSGSVVISDVPFALFQLTVIADGFAPYSKTVEVRNEVPIMLAVPLRLASHSTVLEVVEESRLVDPLEVGSPVTIGKQVVKGDVITQPGREVSALVNQAPGWLLEANGVLHPRGSEYDLQFVIDGLPWYQNRSPAFAPPVPANVEAVRVLTAAIPAEYGRKLGGVIEIDSGRDPYPGLHGEIEIEGASHGSADVTAAMSQGMRFGGWSGRGRYLSTDRYLDPPVIQNLTNHASGLEIGGRWEHQISDRNRLHLYASHSALDYLVPNELRQQQAGQRQKARSSESVFGGSFERVISADSILRMQSVYHRPSFALSSNIFATPIDVDQSRGYEEWQTRADFSWQHGHHSWKAGADAIWTNIRERLHYRITDSAAFGPNTQPELHFADRRRGAQFSSYVQYGFHRNDWTVAAGVRWDRYGILKSEDGYSPRVSLSRTFSAVGLRLHGSYDRIFQTPVLENLLLASSDQLQSLTPDVLRLPLRPGRAHFYEAGFSQQLTNHMRIDGTVFLRDWQNFSDDEVFLATGVSFPLTFAGARIKGEEFGLVIPRWGRFSGSASYSNQMGRAWGPITGGLLLGSEDDAPNGAFPISQDQRNTIRGHFRLQGPKTTWFAFGGQYGSGLPIEFGDDDEDELLLKHPAAVLEQVDVVRGRVRPNWSLDAAVGAELFVEQRTRVTLEASATNLTNRLNVVNFAGLFSGTAIAAPRTVGLRLRVSF